MNTLDVEGADAPAAGDILAPILADLEARSSDLDCYSISTQFERALTAVGDTDGLNKPLLRAEFIAFSFTEGGRSEKKTRPTYFRPRFSGTDSEGVEHEFPALSSVDAATVTYWASRARKTNNPFLQARYADLVWDLSRPAAGQNPDISYAHIAIDASLSAVRAKAFKYEIWAISRLRRALDLSMSLRDASRTASAAAAMIAFEEQISRDRAPGLWGFSFDALILKKVPIETATREKLLSDMESRLSRMSGAERPDPPSIEPALDRLLTYYRRAGSIQDQQRVIRLFVGAVRRFAEQVPPLMASSWLDSAHELLETNGMRQDADELTGQMSEIGANVGAALHANPAVVTIPTADSDNYTETILDGPLDQVLLRFRDMFIVERSSCEEHLRRTTEQEPLLGMIATVVHDIDGRKVASAGSVEDDREGRLTMVMGRLFEVAAPFLRRFLRRFWEVHALTPDKIVAFLGDTSIFPKERLYVIRRGLEAYAGGDGHVASCVLLPEIEVALRRLLQSQAGSLYKRSRSGGTNLRNLDELLREEAVIRVLSEPISFYLRALLTDARGWNLRNQLLHGLVDPSYVAQPFADRVFHVLVLLGSVELREPAAPDGARTKVNDDGTTGAEPDSR